MALQTVSLLLAMFTQSVVLLLVFVTQCRHVACGFIDCVLDTSGDCADYDLFCMLWLPLLTCRSAHRLLVCYTDCMWLLWASTYCGLVAWCTYWLLVKQTVELLHATQTVALMGLHRLRPC